MKIIFLEPGIDPTETEDEQPEGGFKAFLVQNKFLIAAVAVFLVVTLLNGGPMTIGKKPQQAQTTQAQVQVTPTPTEAIINYCEGPGGVLIPNGSEFQIGDTNAVCEDGEIKEKTLEHENGDGTGAGTPSPG